LWFVLRVGLILAVALGLVMATGFEPAAAATHKKRKSPAKKRQPASKGGATSTHKSGGKAARGKASHKSSAKASGKTATRKGAKGKRRASRKPARPARNTQRTPTPERYKEIQQALIAKGYLKEPASGAWDPESVAAMKRFQADQRLAADGKISALSLIALGLGSKTPRTAGTSPEPTRLPQ
jgi:peptidoglycan hydrolase-like protein with peptidoglycan-binding domain